MKSGTDAVDPVQNPILKDTTVEATMTPTETIPGHTTGTAEDITGVLPISHAQMPINITLAMTPHIGDHYHTEVLQLTLETAADHNLNKHIKQPRRLHTKIHHDPGNSTVLHTARNSRVTIDDPQMDFYSSDDYSSDSEEDSDHLN